MTLKKFALRILLVGLAAVALAAVLFFPSWKQASYNGGQHYAEPFRIAGNLYFVGANDVAAFLITGPDGHILIDGGYPGTARMIMASIAELGFDIRDVKILLNSHAHFDHAGGLKELQDASGAALWISEPEADIIAEGGSDDPFLGPLGTILPILEYPAPRVDHRFKDGAKIRVGGTELTGYKLWSAIDWTLALGQPQSNPFLPLIELMKRGLYPLGFDGNVFVVFGRGPTHGSALSLTEGSSLGC